MPADPSAVSTTYDPNQATGYHQAGQLDDPGMEGTFLLGDLSGANARQNQKRQAYGQQKALALWGGAQQYAPSASNLSNPYNYDPSDQGLQSLINNQGLTTGARAAYAGMAQQAGQQAAAQRQAITQQMVSRGMGASGANYAAQLQAGQAGADTAAMGGYQAVAQGEQARNQAIGEQAQLTGAQRANYAQAQERGLQDVYQNYLQMAAGATGQYSQAANMYGQRANQSGQNNAALLSTVGTIAAAAL